MNEAAARLGLAPGIPVVVGTGDVPASQLGAGATDPGDAHVSLGTAVYFGITVDQPVVDPGGRLGVIGHADPRLWILWLEVATGGGALSWLLRALGDGDVPSQAVLAGLDREVAAVADEMDDLLFAPWLSGERVPVFDDRIRGAFVGLGLRHGRAHLLRALMEGVALQMRWALDTALASERPSARSAASAAASSERPGRRSSPMSSAGRSPRFGIPQDAAALGAAACALVAIGAQPDLRFMRRVATVERIYRPEPAHRERLDAGFDRFRGLYDALAPLFARPVASAVAGTNGQTARAPTTSGAPPTPARAGIT